MEPIYIFLTAISILLIVNIIYSLKAVKKESGNELTEFKSSIRRLTTNLKDEFVTNRKGRIEAPAVGMNTFFNIYI